MAKPNRTSFKPGHKRSKESIEKQRKTLIDAYASGAKIPLGLGKKQSKETIQKRSTTRRLKCLGHRRLKKGSPSYWHIMTINGYRYEHRVVMEKILGRNLLRSEHVHHLNGDGLDNRPENLKVVTNSEHFHIHHQPLEQWAKKFKSCIVCHRTDRRHGGGGLCSYCYQVKWLNGRKPKQLKIA